MKCTECESEMNITLRTTAGQSKIYIDTECPKCGARYTGTLKKMGDKNTNTEG